MSGDLTATIPVEILDHIFSSHDESDEVDPVLDLSHVCRRWRPIARQQYAYAQRIVWRNDPSSHWSQRLADAAFLYDRIRASNKPLDFDLVLQANMEQRYVYDTVLPALSQELHRARSIRVMFRRHALPMLIAALLKPAPILRDLRISSDWASDEVLELAPPRGEVLFAGHAPSLTYLRLSGLELPACSGAVFTSVRHLSMEFGLGSLWRIPHHLGHLSPGLKHLTLSLSNDDMDLTNLLAPTFPLTLEGLSIMDDTAPVQRMSILVSPNTLYIQCYVFRDAELIVPYLLNQLPPGGLHASFTFDSVVDDCFDLCIHHPESGLRRSFAFEDRWTPCDHHQLFCPALETRIIELTVDFSLFAVIAALFPSLPALKTLNVIGTISSVGPRYEDNSGSAAFSYHSSADSGGDESEDGYLFLTAADELIASSWPRTALACPVLSKLVLASSRGTTVDDVITFMGRSLGQTVRGAVKLELRNTMLVGDMSRLWGFFGTIVTVPGALQQLDLHGERFKAY